jgi:hypothetical protein
MSGVNSELSIYTLYKKFDDYLGLSGGTVSGHVTFETYIEAKDDIRVGDSGCRISKGGIFHGSGVDVGWKIESPSIFLTGKKDGLVNGKKGDIDFITAEISDKSLYDTDVFKTITPFRVRNNIVDFFHIVANDKENYNGALSALRIELINENDYFANNFLSADKGKAINITANANKVFLNSNHFFVNDIVEFDDDSIKFTDKNKKSIAQIHAYSGGDYKYFNFSATDTFKLDTSNVIKNDYNPTYNNNIRFKGRLNIWSRDVEDGKKIFEMGSDWIKSNNLIKYNKDLFDTLDENQLQDNTLIYKQYVDKQINTVNSNIGTEIGKATGDFVTKESFNDAFNDLIDGSIIKYLSVEGEEDARGGSTIILGTSNDEDYLAAVIPPADINNSGVVSIEEQYFNGTKIFEDGIKTKNITSTENSRLFLTATDGIDLDWYVNFNADDDNKEEFGFFGEVHYLNEDSDDIFNITHKKANFYVPLSTSQLLINDIDCLRITQYKSGPKTINNLVILDDIIEFNEEESIFHNSVTFSGMVNYDNDIITEHNIILEGAQTIYLNADDSDDDGDWAVSFNNEYGLQYGGIGEFSQVNSKGYNIEYSAFIDSSTQGSVKIGQLDIGSGQSYTLYAPSSTTSTVVDTQNTVGNTVDTSNDLYLIGTKGTNGTNNSVSYRDSIVKINNGTLTATNFKGNSVDVDDNISTNSLTINDIATFVGTEGIVFYKDTRVNRTLTVRDNIDLLGNVKYQFFVDDNTLTIDTEQLSGRGDGCIRFGTDSKLRRCDSDNNKYKIYDESMVHYVTSTPTSATGYNDGDIIMVYE